jgi:hypothetical protein
LDGTGAASAGRYRAFISYSHRDDRFAGRLHRRLEQYRLPRRLGADSRLSPIFKDREELPAGGDLSLLVQAALQDSECLIVLCSPDSAASPWVAREIETFRRLHPDRPILAALVRGSPAEAFPPALLSGGLEPLAADFRPEGDGERLAFLKLAAGLAGVGVDQLVQRDAQRRIQRVMTVTAAALAAMLVMALMTFMAIQARAEAERERAKAEGLVEFMITDLRDRLRGVGRLAVLDAVNQQVLDYYSDQDLQRLPPASLARRAMLLQAMGEDASKRGALDVAGPLFLEARRITAALTAADPADGGYLWTHAQSEFWLGFVAFRAGDAPAARTGFLEYHRLARKLVALDPGSRKFLKELAYAEVNLCTLAVELEKDAGKALPSCRAGLEIMQRLSDQTPEDNRLTLNLANQHAWLALAHELDGDRPATRKALLSQEALLKGLLDREPLNAEFEENWVGNQRALSRGAFRKGDLGEARRRMQACIRGLERLTAQDPENRNWKDQLLNARRSMTFIQAAETGDRVK